MNILYIKARNFFTPIKVSSFASIIIATLDNFNYDFVKVLEIDWLINFFLRVIMFSLGFFGIFGNGRTKRIRAIASAFSPLYLSIFYLIVFVKEHYFALLPAIAVLLLFSLWITLFGDFYE